MALVGHATKVTCSLSDGSYGEITGIDSADFGAMRDLLDITDFADTSGGHKRLAGLKDVEMTLKEALQATMRQAFKHRQG